MALPYQHNGIKYSIPNTITPKKDEHSHTCNATIFQHVFLSILSFKQNELPMNKIKLAVHMYYM
jgi:hypothetical protein